MKIFAFIRKNLGTNSSRRLRNINNVPGVIYGCGIPEKNIFIDHNSLYLFLQKKKIYSSIIKLYILGILEFVFLRDYQFHAYKKKILHVDFQRVNYSTKIFMNIPLRFINFNISPAKKNFSGIVNCIFKNVFIKCLPKYLPNSINIDLSKAEINQSIFLSDLILPKGVKLIYKKNVVVLKICSLKKKK